MKPLRRKMVIVGDSGVGKTSLLEFMATGRFSDDYHPCIYGGYVEDMVIHGKQLELGFCDTAGEGDYDRLRPLSYPDSAIIVICFAVDNLTSFHNVTRRWIPEILHFCSSTKVPLLLVACKTDLRDIANTKCTGTSTEIKDAVVGSEQGGAMAVSTGAVEYLECSAKAGKAVREVLMSAGSIATSWDPRGIRLHQHRRTCLIL